MTKNQLDQFSALEQSISDTVQQAEQKIRIMERTHELLCTDAATYNYCPEKACAQATSEITGTAGK